VLAELAAVPGEAAPSYGLVSLARGLAQPAKPAGVDVAERRS
jgi:hypothetical protein